MLHEPIDVWNVLFYTIGLSRHWQRYIEKYGLEACQGPYGEYGARLAEHPYDHLSKEL